MDHVCEPIMASDTARGLLTDLFGQGKGSGAAMVMFILGIAGVCVCLIFGVLCLRQETAVFHCLNVFLR